MRAPALLPLPTRLGAHGGQRRAESRVGGAATGRGAAAGGVSGTATAPSRLLPFLLLVAPTFVAASSAPAARRAATRAARRAATRAATRATTRTATRAATTGTSASSKVLSPDSTW